MLACAKCGEQKKPEEMGKSSSKKNGLSTRCKLCLSAIAREWRKKNPESAKASVKKYRDKNREAYLERFKKYKAEKNKSPEYKRSVKERNRRYYYSDIEKSRAYYRELRAASKESVSISNRKQKLKRKNVKSFKVFNFEIAKIVKSPCAKCAQPGPSTIDHIIPVSRGGTHSIGNLQPLCKSCNSRKNNRVMMEWRLDKSAHLVR